MEDFESFLREFFKNLARWCVDAESKFVNVLELQNTMEILLMIKRMTSNHEFFSEDYVKDSF